MITVRHFAAAAEAAGTLAEAVPASTVGELRAQLVQRHGPPMARVLGQSSLLCDGVRLGTDSDPLREGVTVDVLPPFAGG
jgi:molybdopterin converting factor small subunit